IVNAPFLRADGAPCERPGYDSESAILFIPERRATFPPVPARPTKRDAEDALKRIQEKLLAEFPFEADVDHSVALSAMLTALDRHAMATAPLHAFTSPAPGTGKSLLLDLIGILLNGRLMPVIAQGHNGEETDKRLATALLAGNRTVCLDNCSYPVQSD